VTSYEIAYLKFKINRQINYKSIKFTIKNIKINKYKKLNYKLIKWNNKKATYQTLNEMAHVDL